MRVQNILGSLVAISQVSASDGFVVLSVSKSSSRFTSFFKDPHRPIEKMLNKIEGSSFLDKLEPRFVYDDHELHERDSVELETMNRVSFYTVEMHVGTPPQSIEVIVDTGSSDTWFMAKSNPYCIQSNDPSVDDDLKFQCDLAKEFDRKASSSFEFVPETELANFSMLYGDQTFAKGQWARDVIEFGESKLDQAIFGLATSTNSSTAVMGLGLMNGEFTIKYDNNGHLYPTYENIPVLLKTQGLIQRTVYSMWLNSGNNNENGTLSFGSVDHSKYDGQLALLPIVNDLRVSQAANATSISVVLNGISLFDGEDKQARLSQFAIPVLLDSGATLSYLPEAVLTSIGVNMPGALYSDNLQMYVTACDTPGGIVFDFSGAPVPVDFKQLLLPLTLSGGGSPKTSDNKPLCALGIRASATQNILGDSFLGGVYAVYDLESYEVAIAKARPGQHEPDNEIVTSTIPRAKKAPNYSSTEFNSQYSTAATPVFSSVARMASPTQVETSKDSETSTLETSSEPASSETSVAHSETPFTNSTSSLSTKSDHSTVETSASASISPTKESVFSTQASESTAKHKSKPDQNAALATNAGASLLMIFIGGILY